MSSTTTAVIYVNGGESDRWRSECVRYCLARGYGIAAVVTADRGDRWADVLAMITEERAQVIVVARADQLPPNRPGRIEVVADQASRHRRPTLRDGVDPPRLPPSAAP